MTNGRTAAIAVALAAAGFALGYRVASSGEGTDPAARGAVSVEQARAELAALVRGPATLANAKRLADRLDQLGPEAAPAIQLILHDPSDDLDATRALLLLQFWADHDPPAAADWSVRNAPFFYKPLALQFALERLAETDPQAALRRGGRSRDTVKPVVRGWVRSGQPGVEEWIRDLGLAFERQKALGAYARERLRRDGVAATIAWAEALPDADDGFKLDVFRRLTSELTYFDPAAGVAFYEKHRGGPFDASLMSHVANAWAGIDGAAAMRWLSEQPAGKYRDESVLTAVRAWSRSDYVALIDWSEQQGRDRIGAWFHPALPVFSQIAGARDPLSAIDWAEQIEDEEVRRLTQMQIARSWRLRDAAAADAWIDQSPLSEELRDRAKQRPAPVAKPKPAPEPS